MKEPPVTQNHTRHHQLLCLVLAMMEGSFQAPDTTLSLPVGLRKIRILFLQPYYSSLPSVVPRKPPLEDWSILETEAYLFKPRMSYTILDLPPSSLLQAESMENLKKKKKLSLFLFFSPLLPLLLRHFSRVRLCATPQMAAHQATPSLGLFRQEHWSGLPFPSPVHESEKWKWSRSVLSNSSRPHGLQPTSLLHPWDFPGKSTGVGCHCLLRWKI